MVFLLVCITLSGDASDSPQDQGRDVIEFCFAMECPLWAPENSSLTAWPPVAGASNMHERVMQTAQEKAVTSLKTGKPVPQTGSVTESPL